VADILIRNMPDDVVAALDAQARRLGLSRSEYLRRRLTAEATAEVVTAEHLAAFGDTFGALTDPGTMAAAWR
jgi:plasmid stability protein